MHVYLQILWIRGFLTRQNRQPIGYLKVEWVIFMETNNSKLALKA